VAIARGADISRTLAARVRNMGTSEAFLRFQEVPVCARGVDVCGRFDGGGVELMRPALTGGG